MDVTNIEPVDVEKVAEENPQSRFRILDNPNLAPGKCALCGSVGGDGRQFVDFGKTMNWYGAVYFCTFCVAEAANILGLGNVVSEQNEIGRLQFENQATLSQAGQLQEQVNAYRLLLRNCTCGDRVTHPVDVEVPEAELVEPESNDPDESDADESDSEQGSDDVPADSNDDNLTATGRPRRTRKSDG